MIRSAKDITLEYLSILIVGDAGTGKTRSAATTDGRTLVISCEAGGTLSLSGTDVDICDVTTFDEVREVYGQLASGQIQYDWVFLDSISELSNLMVHDYKKKFRTKKGEPDILRAYGAMLEDCLALIRAFNSLPCHKVFTAKQQKLIDPLTGEITISANAAGQKLPSELPHHFSLVFFTYVNKTEAGIQNFFQTRHDGLFAAKDRTGKLDPLVEQNLTQIKQTILQGT